MDFKHTRLSCDRSITDYSKVRKLLAALLRNRHIHINKPRVNAKNYLDLGCGPNTHEQFINLDYGWHPQIDICWDVTNGIPLGDGAVKGIFSEHCLEHLPLESINSVLGECYRVLGPAGTIRLIVPDGEMYLTRYTEIILKGSDFRFPYSGDDPLEGTYSPILSVNRIFRAHGHLFIYDFDLLRQLLRRNGFVEVKKETFGSGRDAQLVIDSEARAAESLYVEASKPI